MSPTCWRCGRPLTAESSDGQCPACLLALGLASAAAAPPPPQRSAAANTPGELPRRYFADYELLEEIARGGMGVVYRARQLSLNRPVALKMVLEGPLAPKGFIERFHVEGEAAAKLSHPNIVSIYEIGEHQGRHFFSMELFAGGDLRQRMKDFSLPPCEEDRQLSAGQCRARQQAIANLVATIARAVQHAHERGILHRDLKPANILFDGEDQPHVTDFGLAKLVADESFLTQCGTVLGTPAYMAPEQASAQAGQLTTAADVYSLGAILYHLLAGRPAFQAATALETMRQVVEQDPLPPDRLNPRVDRDLAAIALKCLEKEPARRYTSARALAQELESWTKGDTILARPATPLENAVRWGKRNPVLAGLGATVFLLLAALVLLSASSALRIERARQLAVSAQQQAVARLWQSYLAEARAHRWSGLSGRRVKSLQAITNAVAIRPALELRNEAIAALALPDVYPIPGPPRTGHRTDRIAMDFCHDRYLLAEQGGASIRRLADGAELVRLPPVQTGSKVELATFGAHGQRLLLDYADDSDRVWDVQERRFIWVHTGSLDAIGLSPDGAFLAYATAQPRLVVIALSNSVVAAELPLPGRVGNLYWRPDGKGLAAIAEREVLTIDLEPAKVGRRIAFAHQPLALAWHPDGIRLVESGDGPDIHILDASLGTEIESLHGHLGAVTGLSFSPDGALLASDSWDGTLRLWDSATWKNLVTVRAGPERIEFSPDGQRIAVYSWSESRVDLFSVLTNGVNVDLAGPGYQQRGSGGCALVFGRTGQWLATSEDSSLDLWRADSGKPLARWDHYPCDSLQTLPGDAGLFGWTPAGFYQFLFCPTNNGQPSARFERFLPEVPSSLLPEYPAEFRATFRPNLLPERSGASLDGRVLAVAFKGRCFIFDMDRGRLQAITGTQSWMKFVSVSPDGQWVATGGWHNPNVRIWSAKTGQPLFELPTDTMPNVAFSPDGRWLVTSTGTEYGFWRTTDWRPARRIERKVNGDLPGPMAFSRDGRILALADSTRTVHLLSVATGQLLAELQPMPDNEIIALAFSADGSELALTRVGAPPQIWHLGRLRQDLAGLGLDWSTSN